MNDQTMTNPVTLSAGLGIGGSGASLVLEMAGASAAATSAVATLAIVGGVLVLGGLIYWAVKD